MSIQFENLVLAGGGVKGLANIGVLRALEELDQLSSIKRIVGSSAGSISAIMIAVGYTPSEIEEILLPMDFEWFKKKGKFGFLSMIINLIRGYGLYSSERIYSFFDDIIYKKTGCKGCTFEQLFQKCQKDLVITGTSITDGRTHYFCKDLTPLMSVAKAIQISSCLPIVYKPVKYNGHVFVDGGTLNNYPIYVFDNDNLTRKDGQTIRQCPFQMSKTFGVKFLNEMLNNDFNNTVDNWPDYASDLISTLLTEIERKDIAPGYWDRTIVIDSNLPSAKFDISVEQKRELIQKGYNATHQFFEDLKNRKVDINASCEEASCESCNSIKEEHPTPSSQES